MAFGSDSQHVAVQGREQTAGWPRCGRRPGCACGCPPPATTSAAPSNAPSHTRAHLPPPCPVLSPEVQTKGLVNAAGLVMLDFGPREAEEAWGVDSVHQKQAGVCLRAAHSSRGGYGVLLSASVKTDLRIYNTAGRELGSIDSGGLTNYTAAISKDGRWVAAATFTSDVKVRWGGGRGGIACKRARRREAGWRAAHAPCPLPAPPCRTPPPPLAPCTPRCTRWCLTALARSLACRRPWWVGEGGVRDGWCRQPVSSRGSSTARAPARAPLSPLTPFVQDLKGHRSKVHCLDFSPDLTKAVTASGARGATPPAAGRSPAAAAALLSRGGARLRPLSMRCCPPRCPPPDRRRLAQGLESQCAVPDAGGSKGEWGLGVSHAHCCHIAGSRSTTKLSPTLRAPCPPHHHTRTRRRCSPLAWSCRAAGATRSWRGGLTASSPRRAARRSTFSTAAAARWWRA